MFAIRHKTNGTWLSDLGGIVYGFTKSTDHRLLYNRECDALFVLHCYDEDLYKIAELIELKGEN